jgi:hypothetical protein
MSSFEHWHFVFENQIERLLLLPNGDTCDDIALIASQARAENTEMARATFQSVKEARARRNAAAAATRAANRAAAALAARVAPVPVPAPVAPAPVAPAPIDRRAADACLSEIMLSIFC